jgi:ComF family protein
MNIIKDVIKKLDSLLFPPVCIQCKTAIYTKGSLCVDCFSQIEFIIDPKCFICSNPFSYDPIIENPVCANCLSSEIFYEKIYTLYNYKTATKELIKKFKYNDQYFIGEFFAKKMVDSYSLELSSCDIIIPVPMNRMKRMIRFYNQTEVFADYLSYLINLNIQKNILYKKTWKSSQVGYSKIARMENIKNSFEINNPKLIENKKIGLIDDVITTGATVNECSRILKKKGASSVVCFSIARTTF